jgi:hypothetical protein
MVVITSAALAVGLLVSHVAFMGQAAALVAKVDYGRWLVPTKPDLSYAVVTQSESSAPRERGVS